MARIYVATLTLTAGLALFLLPAYGEMPLSHRAGALLLVLL
jgi:hypothetical protein